jgi:hypothetical protein
VQWKSFVSFSVTWRSLDTRAHYYHKHLEQRDKYLSDESSNDFQSRRHGLAQKWHFVMAKSDLEKSQILVRSDDIMMMMTEKKFLVLENYASNKQDVSFNFLEFIFFCPFTVLEKIIFRLSHKV